MKFCTNCGKQLNDYVKFCSACGTNVNTNDTRPSYSQPPQQHAPSEQNAPSEQHTPAQQYAPAQQYTPPQQHAPNGQYNSKNNGNTHDCRTEYDGDIRTFVNSKGDYYISKFRDLSRSASHVSWNWAAFWFAGAWFAYRKMYGIAAIIVLASSVLSNIPYVGTVLGLALNIFSGLLGNWFYKRYVDNELQNTISMKPHDKAAYILQKGGTSIGGMIGMLAINMICTTILQLVLSAI